MESVDVFIGVVSYPDSKFAVNQGESGFAAKLISALAVHGVKSKLVINLNNEFDTSGIVASRQAFRAGIVEEVRLDRRWTAFLGHRFEFGRNVRHLVRLLRVLSFSLRKPRLAGFRRLVNIEASHLYLFRAGLASGAPWILVLEDDANTTDVADLSAGLRGFIKEGKSIAYANLSRSFRTVELGIEHLLTPSLEIKWEGSQDRAILISELPATNTVCAMLYQRDFLSKLVRELDSIPLEPVVPIDWRLNQALMNLWEKGFIRSGECCFVEPAPIDQLSMHS